LQHRFQMPRWQAVTCSERFCCDRLSLRLHRHVNDGSYREDSFAREQRHAVGERRVTGICSSNGAILQRLLGPVELRFSHACR
jgi:hypothetical protein